MSDLPPGFVLTKPAPSAASNSAPVDLPPGFVLSAPSPAWSSPPPGVIIHEANQSYVVGDQGQPTQSVNMAGMDNDQRNLAAAALAARRDNRIPGPPTAAMPAVQGATMGLGDEATSLGVATGQALKGGSFS